MDKILEGQADIFELLGPTDLETPPKSINEKAKEALADEDNP